ncbi:hypothetical protein ABB37_03944 [Leptomonas pyrrhocoris]|uniref:LisH domain-containing protein n=1 Tax=Leptomonas pyrrhocoris TaxID=157538 RepID=A0A0N0DWC3_LEPPY|nr:hypothetical protein ABB37_03944 [Leptomonas pyrrhocoris]KPA81612.1 hypothetical protein ABB37_03944 [Leptomonas pyrrhocoris]|eukprot:XP_015660051.1 hypothetical protein ABB37_03944 [Leptomonas pyrrhocoris]
MSDGAKELSKGEVLAWLKDHNFTQTFEALTLEADTSPGSSFHAAEHLPDDNSTVLNTPLEDELGSTVKEALSAYQQLAGEGSVYALLEQWDPHFLSAYHLRRTVGGTGLERMEVENQIADLQSSNNRLRARERELDTQMKQTVTIIAERLQALVTSVDPMRKDILLPLLRTVAIFGSSSSVRAAARHMMLTLYKRPSVEHRLAILQEWLRIARDAPLRSLEQELIPELYSLVNAQVFERRLLALDCAAAVAPLLRQSPQVRYSLCQGLLRPLCEDDASAVRRELPRCLSLMWGDAGLNSGENVRSPVGGGGGVSPPVSGEVRAFPSTAAAAGSTQATTKATATVSLAPSQQAFVMELLVHLATDSNSRSVRQAAQTQLCEVLYPVFLRDGVLLTQFVPLLLTVISMEASQMLLLRKPNARGGGGGGEAATPTAAAGDTRKTTADATTAAVASALSLNNVMTLVQLLHAALRCVAVEVVHSREEDDRRGERVAPTAAAAAAATNNSTATSLANTYVQVVLPTAHSLLTPLLSKMHYVSLGREDGGGGGSGGGMYDPCTLLCGPLCALCAALASLVPLLGAPAWDAVTRFLKTSVLATPALRADAAAERDAPTSFALPTSQSSQELLRGRLLFAYSYFLLLSGDAVVRPGHAEQVPTQETAENASTCTSETRQGESGAVDVSSQPLLTTKRIQRESLTFLAHQILLDSDNLTSPRSAALTTCVHCIASLAPFAQESREVSSGLTALICFLVASTDPRLRLTAVVVVNDACAAVANERLKVTLLIEPLLPLLEDPQPFVQEAALTGILTVAIALTEPRAQEKTIRPVLRVMDMAGCTSRFTRCVLMQWDQLMQRMPAEPREALLYPQLAALMDRLAEQYVERVSREGMAPPPPATAVSAAPQLSFTSTYDARVVQQRESQDGSVEQWESTMLILQALLHSILRCAVVTPTLVSRYLLPGIQQLASEGVLSACSSNVRTRWYRLRKSYLVFTENNSSRFSSFVSNPSAGNLLDRVKDELKRRL